MKHALFVVFHYPPESSSSGVLRTAKYIKYLEEHYWRVTVITIKEDAYRALDRNLEKEIPASTNVIRTTFVNTQKIFSIKGIYPSIVTVPDRWVGWIPWATHAGKKVLKDDKVDLVYSTSPFASAHLIALNLVKKNNTPWVMDFRDPWYEVPPEPGTTWATNFFAKRFEEKCIRRANVVVTSTVPLSKELAERYPWKPKELFVPVLNGYDEADFASIGEGVQEKKSDSLLILHAGSINAEFRDPRPLFKALKIASSQGDLDVGKIKIKFLGAGEFGESSEVNDCIHDCGLSNSIEFLPRLPFSEAFEEISKADVLLLLQASEDTQSLVPAKLYEYLRMQIPTLALIRLGAASEVIDEAGGGWYVNPDNEAELVSKLVKIFQQWNDTSLSLNVADLAKLKKYDRKTLTRELANVFNSLT